MIKNQIIKLNKNDPVKTRRVTPDNKDGPGHYYKFLYSKPLLNIKNQKRFLPGFQF